jgi:hypothetical protein
LVDATDYCITFDKESKAAMKEYLMKKEVTSLSKQYSLKVETVSCATYQNLDSLTEAII